MVDFRVERSWSHDGYNIWIYEQRSDGVYVCQPVELNFIKLEEAQALPPASLKLNGAFSRAALPALQSALAGMQWFNKEDIDVASRVQKAMQAHIDSLKSVLDKTL